jgi:hypothetical protein
MCHEDWYTVGILLLVGKSLEMAAACFLQHKAREQTML